jgi:hypothetical protein
MTVATIPDLGALVRRLAGPGATRRAGAAVAAKGAPAET